MKSLHIDVTRSLNSSFIFCKNGVKIKAIKLKWNGNNFIYDGVEIPQSYLNLSNNIDKYYSDVTYIFNIKTTDLDNLLLKCKINNFI